MAGTLNRQIRPPSPSYSESDAISLISPLQEEIDVVTELDMSLRTVSTHSFDSPLERVNRHEKYYIPSGDAVFMVCYFTIILEAAFGINRIDCDIR